MWEYPALNSVLIDERPFRTNTNQHPHEQRTDGFWGRRALGGTRDGVSIEGMYDGRFSITPLNGEPEWVQVSFLFDSQLTEYSYPFLFNLRTGETADPLAGIDLSAYPCITYLTICDDRKSATAMAGDSHDDLREILIDLESGNITQETILGPAGLLMPLLADHQ